MSSRPCTPLEPAMEEMFAAGGSVGALMRGHDWAATPFGPVGDWPQSLRSSLSICLACPFPMVIFWGPRLALVYNDAYLSVLGGKHPRSLGQPAEECWHEIWPTIGPMLAGVMERGRATYSHDLLLILQRGGFREEGYFRFSYSPIRDESGGVGGVFCAVTETTERVVAERRLAIVRELGERSTSAGTSAAQACVRAVEVLSRHPADVPFALVYLLDPDGERAELAAAAGLSPGGPLSPLHAADGPWSPAAARRGIVEVDCPPLPELAALAREGFDAPGRALVLPITRPGAEQPAGLLVAGVNSGRPLDDSCRDFTVLVADQIAAAIADATALEAEHHRAEQLAALDQAKTMFFSNISHEFRTPLTLLLGPTEDLLAEQESLRAADRERVAMIHRNALRLLKLVNTLLDFSRAEAGRVQPRLEPVDLAALTAELASLFQVPLERSGLRLICDCRPLPQPVAVDRDMWEKIILNLLSNAFKFTLRGQVTVRLDTVGERARLVVADTGVGIPAEELPRLFDRFHRVAGTAARSEEGSGIGLSLVRELVHQHGGTIEVDSAVGKGSAFTVLLPLGPGAASPVASAEPRRAATSTAYVQEAMSWTPPAPTGHGPAPEVLIVDDNADMRAHLCHVLSPQWRVRAVSDGRAALLEIGQAPPELVLTDVMMPHLDGFGLLKALRSDEDTRHIPVIMLSARAGQEAAIEGLEAGADDYLIKPFTTAELTARVRTHLSIARQRSEAAARVTSLADIAQRLNAGLDPAVTGRILGEEIVPAFAGGCAVWLYADDDDDDGPALPRCLHRTDSAGLPGPDRAALLQPPLPTDPAALPLRHRDRVIGVVTLVAPTAAASHPAQRPFLHDLIDRAALALDNAAHYDRAHRIAVQLQRSLLPPALPAHPGVRLAGRYQPGAVGQYVGGDWYDALSLAGGRLALVIGDVMGRGLTAAALMGQLRTAIAAYALEDLPAALLLDRLNQFLNTRAQRQFTTLCYAIYDPAVHRLQISNAGHLPPLLIPPTGPAHLLQVHHGLILGADPGFGYTSQTFTLPPGSTLLLYTDGLVETRHQPLAERLSALCEALSGHGADPQDVCDRAMDAMAAHDSRDDIALLAVHLPRG
ncbi:SpoIIE family protein phosphatase [Nonomuraea sp. NPDC050643]|uniref:SpoIIE family protein phosphatase n=1 Tax=Nonomuraea sp. NPDC050643 TaxID=3155660 RepID=UPI0033FCBFE0